MFKDLKKQVRANFDKMAQQKTLFYVNINREKIWELYLDGFDTPEERQEHDCNFCKSFLRQYSGVVAIIDNKRVSIWDDIDAPMEFIKSVQMIQEYVKSRPITDIFKSEFKKCGVDRNTAGQSPLAIMMTPQPVGVEPVVWEHFFFMAPSRFVHKSRTVSIDSIKGDYRTTRDMFKRALTELTQHATDTVLELIGQNSLYRGIEFKDIVKEFNAVQIAYSALPEIEKDNYTWIASGELSKGITRIRNSAIGTLIINLSEMMDLNVAVAKYEQVVAPTNYKRTTALYTSSMIKAAKLKLEELGMLGSLERRHASVIDIDSENLLFIDKSSELTDAFEEMTKDAKTSKPLTKQQLDVVEEITIEKFISDVLPHAKSIEVYLQNNHLNKFVTILTGDDTTAPSLFKWNNLFSWSYTGGITDSIKERVKAAGGQITGELRVSLSWHNSDDLDLWVDVPTNNIRKNRIKYSNMRDNTTGGNLDVDMNAGGKHDSTHPVENVIFPDKNRMLNGVYEIRVHQYTRRDTSNVGYTVQIEHEGNITEIVKEKSPINEDLVAKLTYNKDSELVFDQKHLTKVNTKEKWGLKTNRFIKVKQMLLSPNHWNGNPVGNKHFMFMLEDCVVDEIPKPFFNEFLNSTFVENRKVFETLADKFPVPKPEVELSGVGFSETIASEVTLRVEGKFNRLLKIKF